LGTLRHHAGIESRYLQTRHDLIVWLPPGYEASDSRYPVLYLQDGQNLFDPATAFGGSHWRVGETLDECIAAGRVRPMIVVGITNAGSRRMGEYTPTRSKKLRKGGKAERYAQMMVREIKPFVDREYRTLKAAAHTGIGGSSLGALVSLTTALTYSRVFGKVAVVSPSVWWDERVILHLVREYAAKSRPRIWLDMGTAEGDDPARHVEDTRMLRDTLVEKGWQEGENLRFEVFEGADHSERAWAARFGLMVEWLYTG
jgi:predicted alpha/beta superfamily hydrolase